MRSSASASRARAAALAALLVLPACGSPPCVDVSTECDPLYAPTFDNIHSRTLVESCATSTCHGGDSPVRGLDLTDADSAYDALVGDGLVEPGEVGCSELVARVDAESSGALMPPGKQLPEAARCAIRQWIEAGAPR